MVYYDGINKSDSTLSKYDGFRIDYKKKKIKKNYSMFSVILRQFIIAAVLAIFILLFRYIPAFSAAFTFIKNFILKDFTEPMNNFLKSVFGLGK